MEPGFAILLGVVFVLMIGSGFLQHRNYMRATERLRVRHADERGSFLVSGRGKGWLRGSIVLLVIDSATKKITDAEAMVGMSIFARFKSRPELLGPMSSAASRTKDPKVAQGVEYALAQYKVTARAR
ncbi:transcriptional regulator GutM [Humidisolicoccus flavus]|uniref:transcriptional regulator GutM n=1 Tax=Humidisolicoccus flavus TaxID=3111414 RepID=UPI00325686BC